MAKIKTKKSFGGASVDRVSPPPGDDWPKAINTVISFEEALKLHLGLGQALATGVGGHNTLLPPGMPHATGSTRCVCSP